MSKLQVKENLKEYMEEHKLRLLFFGETHGYVTDEVKHLDSLLAALRPQVLLYEMLENKELRTSSDRQKFLSTNDNEKFSIISTYGELKPIIALAEKYDLPIKGCDLHNMGREKPVPTRYTEENLAFEDELNLRRESYQKKIISQSLGEGITFVIIGAYHLREDSKLLDIEDCAIVVPTYKGEQVFGPDMDRNEIEYKIRKSLRGLHDRS